MPDRPTRPGRKCARIVLALLRDGLTDPARWARHERAAVTRLHMWAHRETGLPSWPVVDKLDLGVAGGREPLDMQVARLAEWIVTNVPGEPSRSEGAIDTALRLLGNWQQLLDDASREADRADRAEEEAGKLRQELAREQAGRADADRVAASRQAALLDAYAERDTARREAADTVPHAPTLRPIEEDPHRPHPSVAGWPDDAVLLTYRELRRLVSLHLERYLDDPAPARAMLEADVPLRLGEVLA